MSATNGLSAANRHFRGRTTVLEVITDMHAADGDLPEVPAARARRKRRMLPLQEGKVQADRTEAVVADQAPKHSEAPKPAPEQKPDVPAVNAGAYRRRG